jgi:hypothetical protein
MFVEIQKSELTLFVGQSMVDFAQIVMMSIKIKLTIWVKEKLRNVQNVVKKRLSRAWFRSTDLWVMGPARFRCATLLYVSFL